MPDLIHLLPDSVANQIAAGEVIQRPASVIKELVENAVDAGARNIRVIVADAGRTSIQVIDDGCGMSETDARLAFERHATSKIRKADDLFALHTMGFRGEALPSIAAVAQVVLTTRMATDEVGTSLTIHGSRVVSQEPAACPVGSNFRVDNLFFNVPARRKFLKSNSTELNNILTAFERIVLVYPDISFQLFSNQQELLNLRAATLHQRIVDVFGKKLSSELLPVGVETALCRISGFVGKPEAARKKGSDYFFVNGRYMRHPYFHKAVANAYERLVAEGTLPPYFIYFDVNPANIDVNIHPTKTEIKFEDEQGIFQILSAAVKDAIGRFCDVTAIDFDTEGRPDIPVYQPGSDVQAPRVQYNPSYNPFARNSAAHSSSSSPSSSSSFPSLSSHSAPDGWEQLYEAALRPSSMPQQQEAFPEFSDDNGPSAPLITEKSPQHYQYKGRYVMTAVKSGLMVIDQHRADVRVCYERFMQRMAQRQAGTQRVLFPEVLQLSPSDTNVMQRLMTDICALGFDISDLGAGSFAVNGIPADIEGVDPMALVRNILSDAAEQLPMPKATDDGSSQPQSVETVRSSLALSMARNTATPYGQVLTNEEMEQLVNSLFACENVNYTPDGRPILAILPQKDIEALLP